MNIFKRTLLILIVFGLLLPIYGQLPQNPNIVLIVCDDLNDFEGFFDSYPQSQTPNIDQLAAEGVIFSNAHSNAPICGPSRSSFMTGIYPHNSNNYGFENWYNQTRSGYTINPILENSKTLMQYLKDNGYETYRAGKIMHHDLDASATSEWTETGPSAWPGPVPFDSSTGSTVSHQSVPNTFFQGAGSLNS
jgi:arylsulfatase A-like enzyme